MHPGLLKFELVQHGAALASSVEMHPDLAQRGGDVAADPSETDAPPDASTSRGLDLALDEDVLARVPIVPSERSARFTLEADGDRMLIRNGNHGIGPARYDVRIVPQPRFYGRRTSTGVPMRAVATVYGSYVAIHPVAACAVSLHGRPCAPCAGREGRPAEVWHPDVSDVVEVIRAAFEEGAAEFVYFNPAFSSEDDGGIAALDPYVRTVKRHFDTLVAAQVHPPRTNRWIDRAYAMGIDALGCSVETFDPDAFDRWFPGRARHIGRDRYYRALAYAASVFPRGMVWSELVVGLEPPASTVLGIDELARIGVVPILGVASEALSGTPPPHAVDAVGAASLGTHLYRVVKAQGISMGRIRDLSTGITPLEARFFAGDEARLAVTVQSLYRSRLGGLAARSLARFRRRLRVRAVRDSLDSSAL